MGSGEPPRVSLICSALAAMLGCPSPFLREREGDGGNVSGRAGAPGRYRTGDYVLAWAMNTPEKRRTRAGSDATDILVRRVHSPQLDINRPERRTKTRVYAPYLEP